MAGAFENTMPHMPKASASSTRDPQHFTDWLPDPMISDLLEMMAGEVGFQE